MAWLGKIVCSPPTCQFFSRIFSWQTWLFVHIVSVFLFSQFICVSRSWYLSSQMTDFAGWKCTFWRKSIFCQSKKVFSAFSSEERVFGRESANKESLRSARWEQQTTSTYKKTLINGYISGFLGNVNQKYESFFLEIGKWEPSWKFLHSMSAMNHAHKSKLPETRPNLVFPTHWDTNCIKSQWEKKYTSILA